MSKQRNSNATTRARSLRENQTGGYHDATSDQDIRRQERIEQLGWTVIRFTDKDVEQDAEAVARAIAQGLSLPYPFTKRKATGSGMMNVKVTKKTPK